MCAWPWSAPKPAFTPSPPTHSQPYTQQKGWSGMATLKFAEAIRAAIDHELEADPSVVVMGEEVGPLGGVFTVTRGLIDKYGPDRIMDSPISEGALAGFAAGAATEGMRPVVEIMFSDFVMLAMDQLINFAAKIHYMSNGQFSVPMVVRLPGGAGTNHGPQHSQSLESWFAQTPGLVVAMPSTPSDAYWMMRESIRMDDPVMFFENKSLYFRINEEIDFDEGLRGVRAAVRREGTDLTVVSAGRMVHSCLEAADMLAESGYSVDVIDMRYLWPLDLETVAASVKKTSKLAVVYEAVEYGGWGSEIASWAAKDLFIHLDGPVHRVGTHRVPIPVGVPLEEAIVPTPAVIHQSLLELAKF
ncbi:alpha-ketoacid dehydrogenase subunit beta [Nocardioides cavernae]|uniref:Alpha-ketoacid dehydrogenase subunit beta n=1 Tax=Nocardioides cavernae TaxID=1921566 RepID=A0ABR8N7T3_9ACTN|nr:pyruvate dehydrogenase complex E1 component subunit beta [Nocardioides cavernae]MBD3924221.1 alpha-ketoacid dehydrogenase subunit beta [Nocardioides cavernae]MBM7510840.1 pyruvate dehydrogenase E1 component beta subunit [Nocardioides cavernae]